MTAPRPLRRLSIAPGDQDVARLWEEAVALLRLEYVEHVRRRREGRPTYHLTLSVEEA